MDIDFEEKKLYYHQYYELRFTWYSVDELTNAYTIWIDCTQYGIYISYFFIFLRGLPYSWWQGLSKGHQDPFLLSWANLREQK